jgi:murein DD-endopeptidase MepM/ murein hydrolase activator NlpD
MRARRVLIVAASALAFSAPLAAKKIYKVVDENGITHYTDRKPEDASAPVEQISVRAELEQIAVLRLAGREGEKTAFAANRLHGPVEVELSFAENANITSNPPLPLRAVVPASSESALSVMRILDESQPGAFAVELRSVPGDPAALPDGTVYRLPLDLSGWRIDQGFGGTFSHTDKQSMYAIDFAAPEGTPVLAARAGIVMQVQDDFEGAGLNRDKFGARANQVRVVHEDGTMAVYAHLQPESVIVAPGQRVNVGQRLGASGNTGYSTGPHLHFAVQVNAGMELESIPIDLEGPGGPIKIPDTRARGGE